MAENVVHALQDEALDELLWRTCGLGAADIAPVLEANPGLAELGDHLPAGTPVTIPASAPQGAAVGLIQLWD